MRPPSRLERAGRLLGVLATLGVVWLVVLPHWARQPRMQAALKSHADRDINASATFYTENPAALSALHDLQQLQLEHPGLLWGR